MAVQRCLARRAILFLLGLGACTHAPPTGATPQEPALDRLFRAASPDSGAKCQTPATPRLTICEYALAGGEPLFAVRTSTGALSSVSFSTRPGSTKAATVALDSIAATLQGVFGKPRRCVGFLQWRPGTAVIEADVRSSEDVPQTSRPMLVRVYVEGNELGQGRPC